ncbi:F-ATPase epsilon subunit [Piscirickettsia salmonis]|uniref:ATP synthase epsilon chain n=1 Tax=Piscirickettsia salmonis TaxID=1238 RepID=A0A1L6TFV6_PISSA|nr:F0F1 ATP synthase subunit epsilon [Piscirickettsia salmonis]AKP74841.1 ATP synthase F0F1 subunit epsilon [Piscirickettsia salmonis LF-89 = ATCC VR-1361]ALB21206.1 ATP synthase F1, epsilon subunit [Piscirickettsia salmonis]ALY01469.1 ATP synthase F0F1 subunit epsilon [Piscirickettsia salmonis]AMA40983.1 ATP synthase F0F1 subunit epsilon [Piscirickettsia salmonis]AOS36171.1 ATP synthase F0F1 subunit epsilon [Piscirickettsia salmonis]
MAALLKVQVASVEGEIFSGQATMVVARGGLGEVGITPGHAQLLTTIEPGTLRIKKDNGEEEALYVSGGFLEVQPEEVIVLADTVIRARDLNEGAAREAKERAEALLADKGASQFDHTKAQKRLVEAAAQLRMLQYLNQLKQR